MAVITAPPPIVGRTCAPRSSSPGFGHVRQANEDQILERFADGEQIDPRHAKV